MALLAAPPIRRLRFFVLDWFDHLRMPAFKRRTIRKRNEGAFTGAFLWLALAFTVLFFILPARAQVQNGISEPQEGANLSGVVIIHGTATDEAFLRYEVAFRRGNEWLVFAEGDRPVVDDTLAIWDTTVGQPQSPVFPDGVYTLRLRIVRQDYNYDEYFVRGLVVSNSGTPTPTVTATGTPATSTPAPGGEATLLPASATPGVGLGVNRPTALPSLTPFPTPSLPAPLAGARNAGATPAAAGSGTSPGEGGGGLLGRVSSLGTERFGRAFWTGARVALLVFLLLPLYLVVRWLLRRAWRILVTRLLR